MRNAKRQDNIRKFENSFTFNTADAREFDVHFSYTLFLERNYGADADGNRGWPMILLEDVSIDDVFDEEGESVVDKCRRNEVLWHEFEKRADQAAREHGKRTTFG